MDRDENIWFLDTLAIVRADAQDTMGRLAVLEQTLPGGHSPPPHVHRDADEWFFILEGELTFWLDGVRSSGEPGSLTWLPRGVPHGLLVTSSDPARLLVGVSPAGFDSFVRTIGTVAESLALPPDDRPRPSLEELARVAAEHRIDLLGPPGLPD